MGFSSTGEVCNYAQSHRISWADVCEASSKVVTFIDLAGHEKYLKTTVFGLTGCAPEFAMLMIGANNGVIGMTKGTPPTPHSPRVRHGHAAETIR